MARFSANLGFLWADLPLPQAIRAAGRAGFDAVECHWPHEVPHEQVAAALVETGLPLLGLNTRRGRPGENGLAALPGSPFERVVPWLIPLILVFTWRRKAAPAA